MRLVRPSGIKAGVADAILQGRKVAPYYAFGLSQIENALSLFRCQRRKVRRIFDTAVTNHRSGAQEHHRPAGKRPQEISFPVKSRPLSAFFGQPTNPISLFRCHLREALHDSLSFPFRSGLASLRPSRLGCEFANPVTFGLAHRRESLAAGFLPALAAEGYGVRILGHGGSQVQFNHDAYELMPRSRAFVIAERDDVGVHRSDAYFGFTDEAHQKGQDLGFETLPFLEQFSNFHVSNIQ